MNMQRKIIYFIGTIMIISFVGYGLCVFTWKTQENTFQSDMNMFFSNILLGILGSSIVSIMVAIITYFQERKVAMENYISMCSKMMNYCSEYTRLLDDEEKVKWFDSFISLCKDWDTIWSNIAFLIDPYRHRLYLKQIIDFYEELILLTQNHYRLLREKLQPSAKEQLNKEIDDIIFRVETLHNGSLTTNIRDNNLTNDMELVCKALDEIYRNIWNFKRYEYNRSLVTSNNFVILDEAIEKYVFEMISQMNKTNSTEVELEIPEKTCEDLMRSGYISGYSHGKRKTLNCQFIMYHYFELKKKCHILDDTNVPSSEKIAENKSNMSGMAFINIR